MVDVTTWAPRGVRDAYNWRGAPRGHRFLSRGREDNFAIVHYITSRHLYSQGGEALNKERPCSDTNWKDEMSPRGGGVNRRFKNYYGFGLKECGIKLTFIWQAQNLNKLGSTKCTNNNYNKAR